MIEKLKDLPAGIDGVRAIGKISKEDYEQVFVPLLNDARRVGRYIRFLYQLVREHHREVKRIALAADTKMASLAPGIAEHFIQAEVRSFGYDELNGAIAWAEGPAARSVAAQRSASH